MTVAYGSGGQWNRFVQRWEYIKHKAYVQQSNKYSSFDYTFFLYNYLNGAFPPVSSAIGEVKVLQQRSS